MNKDVDYYALGNRIRDARIKNHLTQEQLGEICDLSTAHIGHIERGTRILSVDTLFRISCALNVSIDSLIFDSADNIDTVMTSISSLLMGKDRKKINTYINVIKILAEKIDEL